MNAAMFALLAASFLSMVDRAALPPMLTAVAGDLGTSIGEVGAALSVYSITYAISQLAWSAVSSRIGTVRVLRIALLLGAAFTFLTACALDPVMLWIGRALSGLAIGAVVPATLVFVGDRFALARRAHVLANLATAVSLGATAAVVVASILGPVGAWRWVFIGTAIGELVIAALLWRIEAGPRPIDRVPLLRSARRVLTDGWALITFVLVFVEGGLIYGVMSFFPAALQAAGTEAIIAGLVTAVFGLSVIGSSQLVKLVLGRIPPAILLLIGGGAATLAFCLVSIVVSVASVLAASALLGIAWAVAHTQIQNWMTDAVVRDRPVGTALFATSMFAGAALGAAIGSAAAVVGAYTWFFVGAAIAGAAFGVLASVGRARYQVRGIRD
ncbi:MAG TPA: MFS transporter [Microbacteriaceae bacterium]|nr:MFS transporter [Microbacteriaceae bacterium]